MKWASVMCVLAACGGGSAGTPDGGGGGGGSGGGSLADCPLFPANNIFNTRIDGLPVDPNSAAYIATISGARKLHLDLGTQTDQQASDFYGIPYNVVKGGSMTWPKVAYFAADTGSYSWQPRDESDCGDTSHGVASPCTGDPYFPIPATPVVEGGINSSSSQTPDGDHHLLIVDSDSCRLWELYHAYSPASGTWNIFGSAAFDLRSNKLRPADWTSADAAGFPILPLLLRADEASTGTINHALRFTIASSKIRTAYVWPARHLTDNGTASTSLPPMGQLFRLRADFQIPASFGTQSKAILQAMKTYGMYIADGGSDMYVSGAPSADWADATFSEVQSVAASSFEAVDITSITSRTGFDPNSGAVP